MVSIRAHVHAHVTAKVSINKGHKYDHHAAHRHWLAYCTYSVSCKLFPMHNLRSFPAHAHPHTRTAVGRTAVQYFVFRRHVRTCRSTSHVHSSPGPGPSAPGPHSLLGPRPCPALRSALRACAPRLHVATRPTRCAPPASASATLPHPSLPCGALLACRRARAFAARRLVGGVSSRAAA